MPIVSLFFDILFGEPPVKYHPTVWIGNLITKLEKILYSQLGLNSTVFGTILVFLVVSITAILSYLLQWLIVTFLSPTVAVVVISLIASTTIAFKSLINHAKPILFALCKFNLPQARKELSMIVGRDTSTLTRSEVARASIEAVAESLGDGIVSPLFWFALLGLPGAFVYRAINTMDSMLGYKSEKYINFGWAAARLDDCANYIPARIIAFPAIILASLFFRSRRGVIDTVKHTFMYQGKHLSPNAGWMEAAAARVIGVSLGGVNYYKERRVEYPQLNPEGDIAHPGHLVKCMKLISVAALFAALELSLLCAVLY